MGNQRTLADILEEITATEIKLNNDPLMKKLDALRNEARNHPSAQAGRNLQPVVGAVGL